MSLCPNCGLASHARCCSWCGAVHKPRRLQNDHCSTTCEKAAARANKISAAMERDAAATGGRPLVITYCINGPGGKEASGIPSLDVAIAMANDFARYGFVYDDGSCDDEDEPWRRADIVVEDCENDWGSKFKMLYVGGREHYGIHEEKRCETCRRPL